jgi:hypothetical protein
MTAVHARFEGWVDLSEQYSPRFALKIPPTLLALADEVIG